MKAERAATINDCLRRMAHEKPDHEVIVTYNSKIERSSLTAAELYTLASRFAKLLKDAGLKRGEYVVISLPNCLEETVTSLGVNLAGGVSVAVEVFLNTGDTFFEVLQKTKCRFLITSTSENDTAWTLVREDTKSSTQDIPLLHDTTTSRAPTLEHSFLVSRSGKDNLLTFLRQARQGYDCPDVRPEHLCVAFTTANSTSFVCLVVHTHASTIEGALQARSHVAEGTNKFLYTKPPTWILSTPGMLLLQGVTRVRLDQWEPQVEKDTYQQMVRVIEAESVDMAFMLAPEAAQLVETWSPRPFPMMRQMVVGAMPVTAKLAARVMPGCEILTNIYASSEMQLISYNNITSANQFQDFDSGIFCAGIEGRVVDADFTELPAGRAGRILLRSTGMFHHYEGQPDEDTDRKIKNDGFYDSGDAGCQRSDGHLLVMGRKDDMILHNVWNVHPSWIEKHIKTHPDIEQVTVVPIPDEDNFQNICACVIRKHGRHSLTEEDVKAHFRTNYVDEEKDSICPTDVLFMDSFPESRPGRVDRGKLADQATEILLKSKIAAAGVKAIKGILNGKI
ncbi:acyl-CoA synthetase family member 2, mitochondrial [Elysia marginata]|uniref:Acyl-CoA synthetase family member 2, mitochondrial n=1 Tax=Elysia marginata TaxID=1093978 RepID=A0AAV4GYW9_9GAST|nr:acyl-CoA synthetase family member 2, mitochondrial [Elysia marginata]